MVDKPQKEDTENKKEVGVMTVPVPGVELSGEVAEQVSAIQSLVASRGWAILSKILNDNIAYLEKAILEKKHPETMEELTDEQVERLRYKRNLNIELRDTPVKYSEVLTDTDEIPENYDPYWNIDDIRKTESSLKT